MRGSLGMKAPGRFLVTLAPGKPAHIQRMPLQSVVHHVASNDLEILALALRFIGSWWRRYQNTGAIRIGVTDGFCRDQLELAILNGQILGDEALQAMQEARSAQALTSVASTGTATGAAGQPERQRAGRGPGQPAHLHSQMPRPGSPFA